MHDSLSIAEVGELIVRQGRGKNAATFYINGPLGVGKSYLLLRVSELLITRLDRTVVFGPYRVGAENMLQVGMTISKDLVEAGYLPQEPSDTDHIEAAWLHFEKHGSAYRQTFIVLIDLQNSHEIPRDQLVTFLSAVRAIEGAWKKKNVRLIHIVAGIWDQHELLRHYHALQVSFPYSIGQNYIAWRNVDIQSLRDILEKNNFHRSLSPLHIRLLHEITFGNPRATIDIMRSINDEPVSIGAILQATKRAAQEGNFARQLVSFWASSLSQEGRHFLQHLLFSQKIVADRLNQQQSEILFLGIAEWFEVLSRRFISFSSWYIELVSRFHLDSLDISADGFAHPDLLMPSLSSVNSDMYRLINEIENHARNFVILQLGRSLQSGELLLANKVNREDKYGEMTDLDQRSNEWMRRSQNMGMDTSLNTQIGYISTGDLVALIEELASRKNRSEWLHIASDIRDLKSIRDAVMHNQLVNDAAIAKLNSLRSRVFLALSEHSSYAD